MFPMIIRIMDLYLPMLFSKFRDSNAPEISSTRDCNSFCRLVNSYRLTYRIQKPNLCYVKERSILDYSGLSLYANPENKAKVLFSLLTVTL